jgi:RNA 3'-terminal phosphate cyclase (ATP)
VLVLDGAAGEGGGQILRSALSLSMISGKAFRIENIRAGRQKPGLLRQHLTAVQACAKICDAEIVGAELGSLELTFKPGSIKAGEYEFNIGSAGSACLVAQSILLPLLLANAPSTISIIGGTHNPLAPSATFLQRSFVPLLKRVGMFAELDIERYGFAPAGAGKIVLRTQSMLDSSLCALHLPAHQMPAQISAEVLISDIPMHVAQRELFAVGKRFGLIDRDVVSEQDCQTDAQRQAYFQSIHQPSLVVNQQTSLCAGNALSVFLEWDTHAETITGLGARGTSAEQVARLVGNEAKRLLDSGAQVGEYLADQLLLPMAVVAWKRGLTSSFDTLKPSSHTTTNIQTIEQFLPVRFEVDSSAEGITTIGCAA